MPIGSNINLEQREKLSKRALEDSKKIFTEGEKHLCTVVQQKPLLNILPHSIVLTNKRVIKHEPRLFKADFVDYLWKELIDVHLSEKLFGAELTFKFDREDIVLTKLPKNQAKKLYSIAQAREEEWIEKKRQRRIEETRAESGANHIIIGNQSGQADIKSKLIELKKLLDEDLITQDEYHNKKEHILKGL